MADRTRRVRPAKDQLSSSLVFTDPHGTAKPSANVPATTNDNAPDDDSSDVERSNLGRQPTAEQPQVAPPKGDRVAVKTPHQAIAVRLTALDGKLPSAAPSIVPPSRSSGSATSILSNATKLGIFRDLFRGRADVFPTRWENATKGTSGYSPACRNKFVARLCELGKRKKVKCADCRHRAFKPVDAHALTLHLRGRHVMGVYPLLADDTCWLLAMDFDESSWRDDVLAVRETCRRLGLAAYVERSRSGNGAHVWLFFSAPVSAEDARKLGCHLLTETMNRRPELSFDSYDRLFPSQDHMPEGGFGNLIALPLQLAAREKGNSVFLDEHLEPYGDEGQWTLLATAERIRPDTVAAIVAKATKADTILGVRAARVFDEEESHAPWTRSPSGKAPKLRLPTPLPDAIHVTLAQRLYVDRAGLPPALLDRIKRLAAFQNPEYYKKRAMRLPLEGTPRIICCAEDFPEHLVLMQVVHPHFDDNKYLGFLVASQTCDLVRRGGKSPKTPYVTLATVRPLRVVLPKLLACSSAVQSFPDSSAQRTSSMRNDWSTVFRIRMNKA